MKKLALIHTVDWYESAINNPFATPLQKEYPELEIINICDNSLLRDALKAGGATPEIIRRVVHYAFCAEIAGADVIMSTCTTMNQAAAIARTMIKIPLFNIDEPMAKQAVELGTRIGIIATVPTSAPATTRLLEEAARQLNKSIEISITINEAAFQALTSGDRDKHDKIIHEEIDKMSGNVDVIAMGQISLAQVQYPSCPKPILQVGKSGFAEAKRLLFG